MFRNKVIRNVLLPAVVVVAEQQIKENPKICRASELPIYTKEEPVPATKEEPLAPEGLLNTVRTSRQFVTTIYSEATAYKRVAANYVHESLDQAEWLIKYLRQEDNTTPKAGAIAIGSLTGFIFGLRGRFFKRLIYTTAGGLGMAAVCYPQQAAQYSQSTLNESKKYATIAYNFIYGVKKDDPPLELPTLPKLPTSLNEVWDNVTKTATNLFSGGGEQVTKSEISNDKK